MHMTNINNRLVALFFWQMARVLFVQVWSQVERELYLLSWNCKDCWQYSWYVLGTYALYILLRIVLYIKKRWNYRWKSRDLDPIFSTFLTIWFCPLLNIILNAYRSDYWNVTRLRHVFSLGSSWPHPTSLWSHELEATMHVTYYRAWWLHYYCWRTEAWTSPGQGTDPNFYLVANVPNKAILQCVFFDDSFQHESHNESDKPRIVLISKYLKIWLPFMAIANNICALLQLTFGTRVSQRTSGHKCGPCWINSRRWHLPLLTRRNDSRRIIIWSLISWVARVMKGVPLIY